jgi:uncharacterized heparinase superfamily protein
MNFSRYIQTLRHLRLSQILGQLRVRWNRHFGTPVKVLAKKVPTWALPKTSLHHSLPDPVPPQDAAALAQGTFTFVNQTASLGNPFDWAASGESRLWQYNLHYFDWLWSLLPESEPRWEDAKRLTLDWIERHPVNRHACGWEPYPTSLRLINWALLFGIRHRARLISDQSFQVVLLRSMAKQAFWLENNLETHNQANHLLENLVALTCIAAIFDRQELMETILPKLCSEVAEQILPDGCHYERSPMYQLRILWLMEVLAAVGPEEVSAIARGVHEAMRSALDCLRHPDGEIAQLNDAALGIYNDGWPCVAKPGSWALPDAGYYGFRSTDGDYLILDAGAIGPDYQPGHAHADFFSFELSLGGQRVVTDTGIGTYDAGPMRAADRSTASHNTVEIDGANSVDVWGAFRVGRRVTPSVCAWEPHVEGFTFRAEHHGYRHLRGRAVHKRGFVWKNGELEIKDEVEIPGSPSRVVNRIHMAPGVVVDSVANGLHCRTGGVQFLVEWLSGVAPSVETGSYHRTLGFSQERKVLVFDYGVVRGHLKASVKIRRLS